ncbi:cytochrome P450 4V2-like isoform X2 [Monomorium pharaonis]|uniref:cytochrome P450 4V2-like isoform X2 n=1 Tax=Monomorium pharaonis TaxID=307658 RepID=UPI0017467C44|nr:cytochrome P450 4V2-like isoform X2 [Monomorium pharaonis]
MDFIFLALYTLCIIVIYAVSSIVHHEYVLRQKLKNIPHTGGYPLIGMTFEQLTLSEYERITWLLKFMEKSKEGIFVQWIGSTPFVVVYKPEYLEVILSSTVNITKGIPYDIIKEWLGNGLLTSTETAMGVNLHAQEGTTAYASATRIASKSIMDRLLQPWCWINWLYYLMPSGKQFKSALDTLHGFTTEVEERKKFKIMSAFL